MASIVIQLQQDILDSKKGVTEMLRTAKVISAELGLSDITAWIEFELNRYPPERIPDYRKIDGGELLVFNPIHGWRFAGRVNGQIPIASSVAELEDLLKAETITFSPPRNVRLTEEFAQQFPQKISLSHTAIKQILESVKNQLLDWTIELKGRHILGDDILFNEAEKQSARKQQFSIQQQHIIVHGNLNQSTVTIHNFGSIHQTLKEAGVPQEERNVLENIMDEMNKPNPVEKTSLTHRAKDWIAKNEKFLGASITIVRKALGVGEAD